MSTVSHASQRRSEDATKQSRIVDEAKPRSAVYRTSVENVYLCSRNLSEITVDRRRVDQPAAQLTISLKQHLPSNGKEAQQ